MSKSERNKEQKEEEEEMKRKMMQNANDILRTNMKTRDLELS